MTILKKVGKTWAIGESIDDLTFTIAPEDFRITQKEYYIKIQDARTKEVYKAKDLVVYNALGEEQVFQTFSEMLVWIEGADSDLEFVLKLENIDEWFFEDFDDKIITQVIFHITEMNLPEETDDGAWLIFVHEGGELIVCNTYEEGPFDFTFDLDTGHPEYLAFFDNGSQGSTYMEGSFTIKYKMK